MSLPSVFEAKFEALAGTSCPLTGRELVFEDGSLSDYGMCWYLAVISGIACAIMYKGSPFISPFIFKKYRTWSREDQANSDTRISSMFHTYLCIHIGYVMLWSSPFFYEDGPEPQINRTNRLTYGALGASLGYFIVDFAACWKYHLGGNEMLMHHIGSLTTTLAAIFSGQCHEYGLWLLLTEATTPFINFRWWLEKEGLKKSPLYLYNGLAIVISWTFARICLFPPFFYLLYVRREQLQLIYPSSRFLLIAFPMLLAFLNVFWYYKIVRGALKLVRGAPPPKVVKAE